MILSYVLSKYMPHLSHTESHGMWAGPKAAYNPFCFLHSITYHLAQVVSKEVQLFMLPLPEKFEFSYWNLHFYLRALDL